MKVWPGWSSRFSCCIALSSLLLIVFLLSSGRLDAGTPGAVKWTYKMGTITSSPAIGADGTIYTSAGHFSGGYGLYALNRDGTLKWKAVSGAYDVGSSPVIGKDGTIYLGATYGKQLFAIDQDGNEKWEFVAPGYLYNATAALGADGTIYVGPPGSSKFYALDPASGYANWAHDAGQGLSSAGAVGSDGTVYFPTNSGNPKVMAVNPDNSTKWECKIPTNGNGSNVSPPAIGSDGTIYVTADYGGMFAINPDTGVIKWSRKMSTYSTPPVIGSDGTVYVVFGDNNLYALNPADGSTKWTYNLGRWTKQSIPAVGADGIIYLGAGAYVYAINPDGSPAWSYKTGGSYTRSSPTIDTDGTVYIGSDDGNLYAFYSSSMGLAKSPWPMAHHDVKHTGRSLPADLVETSISNPPPTSNPGSKFYVTDSLKNNGDRRAPASVTRYYLSKTKQKTSASILLTGTKSVPAIDGWGTFSGSIIVYPPAGIPSDSYYLLACADDLKAVTEGDETNNCITSATTVNFTGPDLVEISVTNPPATGMSGSSFYATDRVQNQGTDSSAASTTRYYLSATKSKANAYLLGGKRLVPALFPGSSSQGWALVTIPSNIPLGSYYVLAAADDLNNVAEISENNTVASATAIRITAAPDLVETYVTNPPVRVVPGIKFPVTDTVQNRGTLTEWVVTTTRYYLAPGQTKTGAMLLDGSRSVPALGVNSSSTGTTQAGVPSGIASGNYYLLACADDLRAVPEGNEDNNCVSSGLTVRLTGPDMVEISVTSPPGTAKRSDSFSVTDVAKNQGDAPAGASTTRYYLSPVADKTGGTLLQGTRSVPQLIAGASSSGTATVKIPSTIAFGVYYLIACADGIEDVTEKDETNNCVASTGTIQIQP